MPKRFPKEFRDDVVRVARSGKFTHQEIAHDFQISVSTLKRWLDQADVDDVLKNGLTSSEQDELGTGRDRPVAPRQPASRDGERDSASRRRLLRQGRPPKIKLPLVRELADEGFPVVLTCGVLGFARQSYYEWLENPISQRDWDDAHLANELFDLHHDDPPFGYRFLCDELKDRGHVVGENRVHDS